MLIETGSFPSIELPTGDDHRAVLLNEVTFFIRTQGKRGVFQQQIQTGSHLFYLSSIGTYFAAHLYNLHHVVLGGAP